MDRTDLAKWVLDHHFGIYIDGVARCSTCPEQTWPCPPARLAEQVQIEELAR